MIGQTISHYRVLQRVGSGGMGVVYEAEDLRLGRRVAIKMLHEAEIRPELVERFRREARSASSLNHPNICTIHGVEDHQGQQFIVMELLHGETLNQRIGNKPLLPQQLLEYGTQIVDALDAAHKKGVIHRDIKPANLFLNDRDQIKILDFGLAKLDDTTASLEVAATTGLKSSEVTREGRTMGTLHYMSPEQARGEELDARTDLFSVGIVLYEMATGTLPFKGGTAAVVFSQILNTTPASPSQLNPALPPRMDEIILKALEKERDFRYQSAAELRADLKRLKRDSESSHMTASAAGVAAAAKPKPGSRTWSFIGYAGVVLALALAIVLWWKPWQHTSPAASSSEWQPLTDFADSVVQPTLSPDGHLLAFIRGSDPFLAKGEIYVKLLPNGEAKQLTHDNMVKFSPAFSPDGSKIVYTVLTPDAIGWSTYEVPALGGEPRLMLPNASGLSYIADHRLIFSEIKKGVNMAIVTSDESRTNERDIYVPPTLRGMAHRSAVSPDGKWVLLIEMDNDGWEPCRLVPFDGSNPGHRVGPPLSHCTDATWAADGRTMYFALDAGNGFHLWRQRFPDGPPEQITFGPTEQQGVVFDQASNSLLTAAGSSESSLWLHGSTGEKQISQEGYAVWPQFTPDGKQLYFMVLEYKVGVMGFLSGELYSADTQSGAAQPVLPGTQISFFTLSPDGKQVAFSAYDSNHHPHVWTAPLDRSAPPRQLFAEEADQPLFAPDGVIYYRGHGKDENVLMRYRPDGGRERVYDHPIHELGNISPDGKWINAWAQVASDPKRAAQLAIDTVHGRSLEICDRCDFYWDASGRKFVITTGRLLGEQLQTFEIPLKNGQDFPPIPKAGFDDVAQLMALRPNVIGGNVVLSPLKNSYAVVKQSTHRNIYRIPLQ